MFSLLLPDSDDGDPAFPWIKNADIDLDLSYATPLLAIILWRLSHEKATLPGPWALGKWGMILNIIGLVFLLFASITFNFPGSNPVTAQNMNYTSAAIGIIGLISLVTWITNGRKHFTGPTVMLEGEGVEAIRDEIGEKGLEVR